VGAAGTHQHILRKEIITMEARPTPTAEVETTGASGSNAREVVHEVRQDAAEQARQVADTAKQQSRTVMSNVGETVRHQVNDQKTKAAQSLRSLSDEMSSMSSERDDAFAGLMSEASTRVGNLSSWIEQREPQDLVRSVEDFARRRPVVFLASAALAGALTGRLTRGMMSGGTNGSQSLEAAGTESTYAPSYSTPAVPTTPSTVVPPSTPGTVRPIVATDPVLDPVQGREVR
jgi:phage-related tail protein